MSFSAKKYFSKIYTTELLTELYKKHGAEAFIEINDQTPRKTAVNMMLESFNSIDPEQKIDIEKELTFISSFSSDNTALLAQKLFKEINSKEFETEIECISPHDIILYFFLRHNDLVEDLIFLHEFYLSKNYFKYEALEYKKENLNTGLHELKNDWERIANENSNATDCEFTSKEIEDILYIRQVYEGSYERQVKMNKKTGEVDRANAVRKIETIRLAYLPKEKLVLVSGNINKQKKLYFMDSFLRIICKCGYEGKIESFDISPFKDLSFNFLNINKGTPLMKWKIKNITLSYKEGKKKLRLGLNSDSNTLGLDPLSETLEELGMKNKFDSFNIDSLSLSFSFNNEDLSAQAGKENTMINVSCSISKGKTNLCPLFKYDNYALKLLKLGNINQGFILEEKKDKPVKFQDVV